MKLVYLCHQPNKKDPLASLEALEPWHPGSPGDPGDPGGPGTLAAVGGEVCWVVGGGVGWWCLVVRCAWGVAWEVCWGLDDTLARIFPPKRLSWESLLTKRSTIMVMSHGYGPF